MQATRQREASSAARPSGADPTPAGAWPAGGRGWGANIVVFALALAAAFGLLEFIQLVSRPLALLLAAIVIAVTLAPAVAWLERRLPRALAIGLVYLLLLLILGLVGWLVVPLVLDQARTLATNVPALIERARGWLDRFDRLDQVGLIGTLVALPLAIVSSATELLLVLAMSAYWLLAMPALRRFALSLFPTRHHERADTTLGAMGSTMGGYVRSVLIDSAIIGALVYAGLGVIGVEYPLVLALIAGLSEVVPIVGPILGAIPAVGIALLDSPTQALIVLAFFVVVQQVESNLLTPYIMRRQTDIPPILTLFALIAGSAVGGILYALIAIPLAGALRVLVLRVVAPAVRGWSGAGKAAEGEAQRASR